MGSQSWELRWCWVRQEICGEDGVIEAIRQEEKVED
jgi:hypothetical protein